MSVDAPDRPIIQDPFPEGDEFRRLLDHRRRRGALFQVVFLGMLLMAVLALATLLYTIVNDAFGLVAVVNARNPQDVVADLGYDPATTNLNDLPKEELVGVLESTISSGVGRRMEREQRFFADRLVFESQETWDEICAEADAPEGCTAAPRDQANVFALVNERVVQPDVIAMEDLVPSLLDPEGFQQRVLDTFETNPERFGDYTADQVVFEWRAWLNPTFLRSPPSATPEIAGIRTAILGTVWLMAITLAFAVPVGVGAAIYLEEFARPSRFNDFVQTNIANLAGVPSIVYGMLGLAIFVRTLEPVSSGALFGTGTDTGRTVLAGGMTMGLLILPVVIISAQEALKSVPGSLRHAGLALGATRWQTVRSQVLPVALPGILTGVILSVARAIGETAPLLLAGAATFITLEPDGPFSRYTALPIQIFEWAKFPQDEFRRIAAAAIIVLLVLLLTLNAAAVILRNRYSRRA